MTRKYHSPACLHSMSSKDSANPSIQHSPPPPQHTFSPVAGGAKLKGKKMKGFLFVFFSLSCLSLELTFFKSNTLEGWSEGGGVLPGAVVGKLLTSSHLPARHYSATPPRWGTHKSKNTLIANIAWTQNKRPCTKKNKPLEPQHTNPQHTPPTTHPNHQKQRREREEGTVRRGGVRGGKRNPRRVGEKEGGGERGGGGADRRTGKMERT